MISSGNILFDIYSSASKFIDKNGFIKLNMLPISDYENFFDNIDTFEFFNEFYYIKSAYNSQLLETDAEILNSQILSSAGLKTAIYLPCLNLYGRKSAVSNDVSFSTDHTVHPALTAKKLITQQVNPQQKDVISFLNSSDYDYSKFLSQNAIVDLFKLTVLDLASGNQDRHDYNMFALYNDSGLIDRIIPIDSADSANATKDIFEGFFKNEFMRATLSPYYLIQFLKLNSEFDKIFSIDDILNLLSQIKIPEICKDIYDSTGFKIDENYSNIISERYKRLADIFEKGL